MKTCLGWSLVRVRGESMRPRLEPGDFAIFKAARAYAVGDTVLVDHPVYGRIVKSVRAFDGGRVWLAGTAPKSISAEALRSVPRTAIIGRQIWRVRQRASRTGSAGVRP